MKYVVVVGDGMADYPVEELGRKTPLMVAAKPNMDSLAKKGRLGRALTVPPGFEPGSDVAIMSIFGYDPAEFYTGRAPLEAAALGVDLEENDVAVRCNLVTIRDEKMLDYSAGHISSEEAAGIVRDLGKKLGSEKIGFFPGVSYRHLVVLRQDFSDRIACRPPHDMVGERVSENMVRASEPVGEETARVLNELVSESRGFLEKHPVNVEREKSGKNPANSVWFWGQGKKPSFTSFSEKYGVDGSVITAVDLIRGLAKYAGLGVVEVEGATGYLDTNYEGKADAALRVLEKKDFVLVHVEAPDEAGHEGKVEEKIRAIEDLDKRLIARLVSGLKGVDYRICVLPDHPTPVGVRTHTRDPVPFLIYDSRETGGDACECFDEETAEKGSFRLVLGTELLDLLFEQ